MNENVLAGLTDTFLEHATHDVHAQNLRKRDGERIKKKTTVHAHVP